MSSNPEDIRARVRAAFDEDDQDAQRQLGVSQDVASRYQPDQFAEATKLGAQFGVPARTVADNPEPYRKQSVRDAVRAALADTPATQAWMSNPDNAAVAQDDVESLAKLERGIGKVSGATRVADVARSVPGGLYKSFGMSISGVGRLYGAGQRAFSNAAESGLRAVGADSVADTLTAPRESLASFDPERILLGLGGETERTADILGAPAERQNIATDIAGGLGQIAGQIATALTGGSVVSTLSLLGQGADIQGDRAEAAGASQQDIDNAVVVGSLVTAVTERYQLDQLLNRVPPQIKQAILARLASVTIAGGGEALQEVVEGIGQNLTAKAIYEPDAPLFEGLERDAIAAGGAGAIAKAVIDAIVPGKARVQGRGDADAAAEISTILDVMNLTERSPEQLESLAAAIKERTGAEYAYVDPAAFRTLYQSDDEANAAANELTGGQGTYFEAALSGTPIAIPLEKYIARVAPRAGELKVEAKPFTDFVSFDPDGMNGAESDASRETSGAQAKEIADREIGESRADTSEGVYDDVVGQLLASGMERSTAEKNAQLMQSVFRSLGQRAGIDPKALYDRYNLRIKRELPDVLTSVPDVDLALDPLLDRLRAGDVPSQSDAFGPSLLEFIRTLGGLKDEGGELAARDIDKGNLPFQRNVLQPNGRSLDDVAELLVESGYMTERDPNALLDLIDQELRGEPAFAFGNQKQEVIAQREYLMQLEEQLGRRGIDLKQTSNLEARRLLNQPQRFDQSDPASQPSTPAFERWFKDSKAVDTSGKPLVLYHGTRQDFDSFDPATQGAATEAASAGKGFFFSNRAITADSYTNLVLPEEKEAHDALFNEAVKLQKSWMLSHSSDPKRRAAAEAKARESRRLYREAAEMRGQGGNVMPVFLSLQNPMIHDMGGKRYRDESYSDLIDQAIAAGHDGLIIKNTYDAVLGDGIADDVYVAFKPEQIKSALGNSGAFDPSSPNVLEQRFNEAKRGAITFGTDRQFSVSLFEKADLSTFLHESGHFYLEILGDLAEDASAPQQIKDDYNSLLKWLGVKGRAGILTEQHEQFARGFEAYLFEGKSPSQELATVFDRFRAWLIGVYRTLARLNVTLNDEVRGVMDRIVASQEEIKAAERGQGYAPIFATAEDAGMSQTEWSAYRDIVDRAHRESVNELTGRAMRELARERKAWWKEEHAKVLVEVATEVDALPAYQALAALTTGKLADGTELPAKLSKADVVARYGKDFAKRLPRKAMDSQGISAEVMAQLLGFESGDALVQAIVTARPRKELIKAEADARMRERYGDMLTDGTLIEQAITSVHVEARAKVLAAELRALKRKRAEVKPFTDAAEKSRRQAASDARAANYGNLLTKAEVAAIREQAGLQVTLSPDTAPDGYAKLADRAGKKAFDFASEGKFEDAAQQKRIEVLNRELYYAALDAQQQASENAARKKESDKRAAREANAASLPTQDEMRALRIAAQRAMSAKKIRQIQPALYRRAEAKAAREAFEFAGKGNFDEAYDAKRRQIYNYELFRAAVEARNSIDKQVDYMRRFDKKPVRAKLAAAKGQYLQQIDALRARFDFSNQPANADLKRDKLNKWVEEQIAAGKQVAIPQWVIDEARTTPYKELLAIELDGLVDAAKNIEHLARTKDRLLRNRKEADFKLAKAELEARAKASLKGGKAPPVSRFEEGKFKKFGRWAHDTADSWLRPETIIEWLDGGQAGPWHDFIMEPANNSEYARESLRTQILEPMRKLANTINRARRNELHEQIRIDALNQSFDRRTLISVALNMGNESNLERLLKGGFRDATRRNRVRKFTPAALEEIKRKLNAADWKFIQEAWNTAELLWPQMKAFQERMGGLVPEKIPATPVVTPHGTFAGGYWPAVYDPLASTLGVKQAEAGDPVGILMGANFSKAVTGKSALQERGGAGGPLLLDFSSVMGRHMDQVITDITHREFAIQAMRILDDPDLRLTLQDSMGEVAWRSLRGMVKNAIQQDGGLAEAANAGLNTATQRLLSGTAVAALGFKVTTAFGNLVLAPIQAGSRVSPKYILSGVASFMRHPLDARAFVDASSEMMRNRAQNMDASFTVIREQLEGRVSILAKTQRAAMAIHRAADHIGTTGIWIGRYRQALDKGESHEESVRLADKAIRTTQTAGAPKDLSAFERDPTYRIAKLFIGPMIIMGNRIREASTKKGAVKSWPEAFGVMMAAWLLPAILWDLLNGRGPDDDDDDGDVLTDEFLPWAFRKVLFYPFATIPYIRDAASLAERKLLNSTAEPRMTPAADAAWLLYKAGKAVTSEATSEEEVDYGKLTQAGLQAVGPLVGLPTNQLDITGSYLWDVFTGEYEPEGVADLRYLVMRRPKEE